MNDIKKIVLFKDGVSKDKGSWVIFRDSGYEIVSLDEGKKIVLDYAERHGINTVEKANKELYDKVVFYSPNIMLAFRYNLNKQEVSVSDEKTESEVGTFAADEVEIDNGDSFDFEEGTIAKPLEYRKTANYGFGSNEADGSNSEDVSVEKTESEVSTFADVDDVDDEVETEETAYEYVPVDDDSDIVEDEKTESEVSTFAAHVDDGADEVETEETAYEYVLVDNDSDVVEDEKTESEVSTFAAHVDDDEVETDNGDSFDFEEGTIAEPFEYGKFSNYGFGSDEADGSNSEDVSVEKTESEVSTFADVDNDKGETDNGDSFDFEEGTIAMPFEYGKTANYGFGSDEADGSNSEDVSVKKTESEVSTFAAHDDDDEVETEETADEFVLFDDDESDDEIDAEETADEYNPEADDGDDEVETEETADEYNPEADDGDDEVETEETADEIEAEETADEYDPDDDEIEADESDDEIDAEETADEIEAEETVDEYDPDDDDDDESDDEIDAEETADAEKRGFFDKFLDFIMKYGVNPKEDEFIYDEDEYDSEEDEYEDEDEDEYDSEEDEYEDEDEDEYDSEEDEDEYEDEDEDLGMFEKLKIMGGKLLDFINKSTLFHVSVAVISGIIIFFGIRFFESRDKDDIYVNNHSNTVNVNEDSDYFTSPLASFFNKIFSTRNSLVEEEIKNKDSLTENDSDIAIQSAPYSQDDDISSNDNSSNASNNSNSSNDNSDITVQYAPYSQDGDTSSYDNSSNSYNNSNSSNDNSDMAVQYASYSQDDDISSNDNSSNASNNSNSSNDNSDMAVQYASYSQDDDISINDSSDNTYYDEESATVYEYGVSDSVENSFNDISESHDSDDIAITDDELFYLDNVDSDIVETEDEPYDYTIYNSLDTVNGDLPGIILYDEYDYSNISNFYDNSTGDQTNLDLPDPNDYSSFIDYYINSLANTNPDLPDNGIQYTKSI